MCGWIFEGWSQSVKEGKEELLEYGILMLTFVGTGRLVFLTGETLLLTLCGSARRGKLKDEKEDEMVESKLGKALWKILFLKFGGWTTATKMP